VIYENMLIAKTPKSEQIANHCFQNGFLKEILELLKVTISGAVSLSGTTTTDLLTEIPMPRFWRMGLSFERIAARSCQKMCNAYGIGITRYT
jgi:hypothetical protein